MTDRTRRGRAGQLRRQRGARLASWRRTLLGPTSRSKFAGLRHVARSRPDRRRCYGAERRSAPNIPGGDVSARRASRRRDAIGFEPMAEFRLTAVHRVHHRHRRPHVQAQPAPRRGGGGDRSRRRFRVEPRRSIPADFDRSRLRPWFRLVVVIASEGTNSTADDRVRPARPRRPRPLRPRVHDSDAARSRAARPVGGRSRRQRARSSRRASYESANQGTARLRPEFDRRRRSLLDGIVDVRARSQQRRPQPGVRCRTGHLDGTVLPTHPSPLDTAGSDRWILRRDGRRGDRARPARTRRTHDV